MLPSHQQQQLDVTRRRFVQAVLQPGPVQPVIEELPRRPQSPEEPKEDVYDDQPAVFDMDDDDTVDDSSNKSTDTDSATSPNTIIARPPRSQATPERTGLEFMPSIAVSEQRSSGRLSSMSSSLSTSASARSLSRLGMGHSVQPTLYGRSNSSHGHSNSSGNKKYEDYDEEEDEDDTTIVIAPHDVTAALSQPAASFGFVPPHLVSDLPEY